MVVKDFTFISSDAAMVDSVLWYTVACRKEVAQWIRTNYADQENQGWFQHIDQRGYISTNIFDVNEHIYTTLVLKWR